MLVFHLVLIGVSSTITFLIMKPMNLVIGGVVIIKKYTIYVYSRYIMNIKVVAFT